ncbi:hypothetical protein [Frigoriglobus tundricola]|uniref:hypothetical protein n=1 Tax=Frigoriglobus tundricola TaxID=2774151 RepID=UPI00148E9169|nr:hypothetical protein [Frigoriglobus tundricola]
MPELSPVTELGTDISELAELGTHVTELTATLSELAPRVAKLSELTADVSKLTELSELTADVSELSELTAGSSKLATQVADLTAALTKGTTTAEITSDRREEYDISPTLTEPSRPPKTQLTLLAALSQLAELPSRAPLSHLAELTELPGLTAAVLPELATVLGRVTPTLLGDRTRWDVGETARSHAVTTGRLCSDRAGQREQRKHAETERQVHHRAGERAGHHKSLTSVGDFATASDRPVSQTRGGRGYVAQAAPRHRFRQERGVEVTLARFGQFIRIGRPKPAGKHLRTRSRARVGKQNATHLSSTAQSEQ